MRRHSKRFSSKDGLFLLSFRVVDVGPWRSEALLFVSPDTGLRNVLYESCDKSPAKKLANLESISAWCSAGVLPVKELNEKCLEEGPV